LGIFVIFNHTLNKPKPKPPVMTQTYASEFRKGKILWDTKEMFITKVENVNEKEKDPKRNIKRI